MNAATRRWPDERHNPPKPVSTGWTVGVVSPRGELIEQSDLAQVEALDDVIFDALAGKPEALDHAARRWAELRRSAPASLVEESREQYLRQAEAIVLRYRDQPEEVLGQTFAALEIIALLAD